MLAYSEPPGYRRVAPIRRPKLDLYTNQIDQWLAEDKTPPRKQRHTAKRIFERLRDECGFDGGYDGKGRTALFRLTMMPKTNKAATREPANWELGKDYPVTVYGSYSPKERKKQNPPPRAGALARQTAVYCASR
jgi:hypothetical protein